MTELVWFDLSVGTPTALRILRQKLSNKQLAKALFHYLRRNVGRDPLRGVELPDWPKRDQQLAYRQFRSALALDDCLRIDMHLQPDLVDECVGEIISEVGSRFIGSNVPMPEVASWEATTESDRSRFLNSLTQRFFNARVSEVKAEKKEFGFDVTSCQFVKLAHTLGRPELVKHFCAADSVFFMDPSSPVELRRAGTIAAGAPICDFRFRLKEGDASSENRGKLR